MPPYKIPGEVSTLSKVIFGAVVVHPAAIVSCLACGLFINAGYDAGITFWYWGFFAATSYLLFILFYLPHVLYQGYPRWIYALAMLAYLVVSKLHILPLYNMMR